MRRPSVADQFYPGSPAELSHTVESLLESSRSNAPKSIMAAVAPHAGYVYSGQLAAETLGSAVIPENVAILGPNHRGTGAQVALSNMAWDMVLGKVEIDHNLNQSLQASSGLFTIDDHAHQLEHSLEVQIPILQKLQDNLHITPIVLSHISFTQCEEVASAIAAAIKESDNDVLIVASSDMNHYESRNVTQKKDSLALDAIREFDPYQLYHTVHQNRITMCGVIPVVISMLAAQSLGANSIDIVGYTDSGYVAKDSNQVVGYAGIHIY